MNVTSHSECTRALANLYYCPICRGVYDASPCNSFCLNISTRRGRIWYVFYDQDIVDKRRRSSIVN
ncbi:glypican-5-like [Tropilaelaps mercedesae]|uniref:Glypican-5-like n=1 Tax=Tropilaelaps mercedesae TaxID=418985 RepID=A0A1V9WY53_9ACAR|nr:glypican-5-like [Tropilaelaps mercedesae]